MSEVDDLINPPPLVEQNPRTHAGRPERLRRWYELFRTTFRYVSCSVEGCPGRSGKFLRYCDKHAIRLMQEKRPGKGDLEISEALLADATETGPFPRPGHTVVNPATEKDKPEPEYGYRELDPVKFAEMEAKAQAARNARLTWP